jgi:hypothetical protein
MGSPTMSTQPSTQPGGKGFALPTPESQKQPMLQDQVAQAIPQGKGAASPVQPSQSNVTYPSTSGQPVMGQPNQYSNTVGLGDNQQQLPQPQVGKGKGA